MKRVFAFLLVGLVIIVLRFLLVPYVGLAADLLLVVPPFFMWLKGSRIQAVWFLVVSCALADALSPNPYPVITLASLLAGSWYVLVLEPFVSSDNAVMRVVAVSLWLTAWRGALVGVLWLSAVWQDTVLMPHAPSMAQVAAWFVGGGIVWALLVVAQQLVTIWRHRTHGAAG